MIYNTCTYAAQRYGNADDEAGQRSGYAKGAKRGTIKPCVTSKGNEARTDVGVLLLLLVQVLLQVEVVVLVLVAVLLAV